MAVIVATYPPALDELDAADIAARGIETTRYWAAPAQPWATHYEFDVATLLALSAENLDRPAWRRQMIAERCAAAGYRDEAA